MNAIIIHQRIHRVRRAKRCEVVENSFNMKLISQGLLSPYSRKVRIVLAEKRIDYEMLVDNPLEPASRVPEVQPARQDSCARAQR